MLSKTILLTVAVRRPWLISHVNEIIYLLCPKIDWSVFLFLSATQMESKYVCDIKTPLGLCHRFTWTANNKETSERANEKRWIDITCQSLECNQSVHVQWTTFTCSICGCLSFHLHIHTHLQVFPISMTKLMSTNSDIVISFELVQEWRRQFRLFICPAIHSAPFHFFYLLVAISRNDVKCGFNINVMMIN